MLCLVSNGAEIVSSASELSRSSTEESKRGGQRVSRSLERAKQNSALALSHKGRRKGAPPRRDSKLVQEERERKLLHSDYTIVKNHVIHKQTWNKFKVKLISAI